jgi:hypothetical protein
MKRSAVTNTSPRTRKHLFTYLAAAAVTCALGVAVYLLLPSTRLERRIRNEVNKKWPPARNPADAQLAAINNALSSVDKSAMPTADAYVGVSKETLQEVVPDLMKAQFPEVRDVSISLGNQEVISDVTFEIKKDKPPFILKGSAKLHCSAVVKNGAWTLRPVATEVRLRSVKVKGLPEVSFIVPIANSVLATFVQNVSSQVVKETSDKISFSPMRSLTPKEVLGDEHYTDLTGNTINLRAGLGTVSVLVDQEGLHVLGNIVPLAPARFKEVMAELKEKPPTAATILSSKQSAVLSQCDVPASIHNQKEQDDYEEFKKFCAEVAVSRKQAPPETASISAAGNSSVQERYSQLVKEFRLRAQEVDTLENLKWNKSGVFISKSFIAQTLNDFAGDPHYAGVYQPADYPFNFRQEVRSDKAPDLKCDDIPCNCTQDTEPHWNCEGRGCPSDCAWYDAGCHAWKPVCEGLKAADKGTCELDKGRYRLQKNIENQGARELYEAKKAGCNVNQQWLNTWSETQIGLAEVNGDVKRLAVSFEVKSFQISPSLTEFSVNSTFKATSEVTSTVKFTPRDFGNLACVAQWTGAMNGEVSMDPLDFLVKSKLVDATNEKDYALLMFASEDVATKIKFAPPPFQAVLDHNPLLYIGCTGGVIGKLVGAGSKDTFDYIVPTRRIPMKIPGGDFSLFGTTIYYRPVWTIDSKSVRLKVSSPIWKLKDAS